MLGHDAQVRPLRKQLKTLKAWITGQRKDQSPGTRSNVPVVEVDPAFEGKDGGGGSLIKFNPLSNVTSQEVWNFLRIMVRNARCPATILFCTWCQPDPDATNFFPFLAWRCRGPLCRPTHNACKWLCRTSPPMRCIPKATSPWAASHAHDLCFPTSMSGKAGGGGR